MIKTILIKRLLLSSTKNKKKLKLLADISIFLIVVAIISSAMSIYFENKLTKYRFELSNLQYEEYKIQQWIGDTTIRNSQNRDGKFIYSITQETETIKISKARYYFHLLDWYPWVLEWALEDAKKIGTDDLRKKHKIDEKIIKLKEISKFVLDTENAIYTNMNLDSFLLYDYKLEEKYWEINDEDKIYEYLNVAEKYMFELYLYFSDYNNIADKKKNELNATIIKLTDRSNDLIFYAFLIQLVIFVILQIFELRELK